METLPGGSMPKSTVFFFVIIGCVIGLALHANLLCIATAFVIITTLAFIQARLERSQSETLCKREFLYAWISCTASYAVLLGWFKFFDYLQSIT